MIVDILNIFDKCMRTTIKKSIHHHEFDTDHLLDRGTIRSELQRCTPLPSMKSSTTERCNQLQSYSQRRATHTVEVLKIRPFYPAGGRPLIHDDVCLTLVVDLVDFEVRFFLYDYWRRNMSHMSNLSNMSSMSNLSRNPSDEMSNMSNLSIMEAFCYFLLNSQPAFKGKNRITSN